MKLASHNSWSFGRPQRWWMRIFQPFSKCQDLDIREQFHAGVRMFDLRLKKYRNAMYTSHGMVVYGSPSQDIVVLNNLAQTWGEHVYVRVLLESRFPSPEEVHMFRDYCEWLERRFAWITFFGGHGAHGDIWYLNFYRFSGKVPTPFENHCSIASGFHPIPYLYARKHNRKHNPEESPNVFLMQDFIQY